MGTVTCDIQYSGRAAALVVAAAVATMALAFATPLALTARLLALLWIALVSLRSLRRLRQVRGLRLDEAGSIEVLDGGGWLAGRVRDGCVALPWLTVVRWRPLGARMDRAVWVMPGMVDPAVFRELRVALRWGKP